MFFYRVFGRFVTRGVQKRDKKKSRENLLSFQKTKKIVTYLRQFFVFVAPLGLDLDVVQGVKPLGCEPARSCAMGTPLVLLSHPVGNEGAGISAA
jgi:hypothetical protein